MTSPYLHLVVGIFITVIGVFVISTQPVIGAVDITLGILNFMLSWSCWKDGYR